MALPRKTKVRPPKPKVSIGARMRIAAFVAGIEELRKRFDVAMAVQDDSLGFRDLKRPESELYTFDAQIFTATNEARIRRRFVRFETFDWWDD
jgi:hypothetical protein